MYRPSFHEVSTRPLVAVEPRRPPKTNVGTETPFRHDHWKHFQKSKRFLRSKVTMSWCDQTRVHFQLRSTTLAKKIVTAEKFMRLIFSSIMWSRAISSFGPTSTRLAASVRRELTLQIEVDVAWYQMIALRINLRNISAVTIFLARVVHTTTHTWCSASSISTQKETFPRSEFTLALNLDILDAGQSPNAVRVHAGTTQVDFEVDRPPPADS